MNAREAFIGLGHNFMTPDLIRYQDCDNGYLIELSIGRGFDNDKIWGVTVLNSDGTRTHDTDLSQMFHSRGGAERHITTVACDQHIYVDVDPIVGSGKWCHKCGKVQAGDEPVFHSSRNN